MRNQHEAGDRCAHCLAYSLTLNIETVYSSEIMLVGFYQPSFPNVQHMFNFLCRYGHIVSLLSCFAAGVFMGTGLLHLFPDVNEMLSKVNYNFFIKPTFKEFDVSPIMHKFALC